MRTALIVTLALVALAVHFANGSPAGANAYLFFATLLLSFGIYSRGMRRQNYWLSLTGLVEAWFLFDYCAYGTAVSVLERSKTPLPASMDEAYSRTYLVGALAFLAFACGAHAGFARSRLSRSARSAVRALIAALRARRQSFRRNRLRRVVYLLFTAAGALSIAVLLLDPESRQQLFFDHVGLSPRQGMGRYTSLLFMLPTTAVGLWYLSKSKRRYSRVLTLAGLFLIAAIPLGCGRRLMWAGTMLMVFHLCKVRGIFTLRARYLAAALPLVLLVSVWMEATKNIGWYAAADAIDIRALADGDKVLDMVDNSVGRFDTTAALIVNRETLPYYYGETFLMAPLQVLPVSAGFERSRGVREELGELIYGAFDQGLVSQEASLVGELYANFSYGGVLVGFLLVGFGAAFLDGRCHHNRHPMVALGYGLCLFRAVHQLATASTSWFPLTFFGVCAVALCNRRDASVLEALAMIVHVGPSHLPLPARLGGAIERRMVELAEAQARGGERVIVYSGGPETGWRDYHGVSIRYLSGSRAEFALHFVHDVARRTPRVIHVHNRPEIAWLTKTAALAPAVLNCDYHFEPWRRFAYLRTVTKAVWRHCLLACDRLAPVSDYCREMYQAYWNLPDSKLAPIPNGVDCARFRPDAALRAEWRARLGIDARPMILYVGRLCHQKGTDLLIAAYRMLKRPAALVVAGPCEQFGQTQIGALVAQIQEAGGTYLPPLDDADMPGIYNACDIFAMPTRELEMFGMAAVEAQACGKPVVASDHGGLRETVPETAGVRFRTGDATDLAARLEALLAATCDSPDLLGELAAGARENASRYDWPRIAQRCQEVYAAL